MMLMWIPSHIGIKGTHKADERAKEALRSDNHFLKTHYRDFWQYSKNYVESLWQENWDREAANKLPKIIPRLEIYLILQNVVRTEKRNHIIDHGYVTHSHLWKREETPNCFAANCREPLTMEHLLLKRQAPDNVRLNWLKFYKADNMKVLLLDVLPDNIFKVLKVINVF